MTTPALKWPQVIPSFVPPWKQMGTLKRLFQQASPRAHPHENKQPLPMPVSPGSQEFWKWEKMARGSQLTPMPPEDSKGLCRGPSSTLSTESGTVPKRGKGQMWDWIRCCMDTPQSSASLKGCMCEGWQWPVLTMMSPLPWLATEIWRNLPPNHTCKDSIT